MGHSFCRVYVNFVWTTKRVQRILTPSARSKLHAHLLKKARDNSLITEALNVQPEHVHLFVSLSRIQAIEEVAKLLKGESSHWMNHGNIVTGKFSWQTGYGAFSVSYTHYKNVVAYINSQDEHHNRITFAEEYKALLRKYGYKRVETDESVLAD